MLPPRQRKSRKRPCVAAILLDEEHENGLDVFVVQFKHLEVMI